MQEQLDFAHSTFSNLQELARMADSKANTAITLNGIFLGVFFAILGTTGLKTIFNVMDGNDGLSLLFAIICVVFVISALGSLCFSLLVIWPRERERVPKGEGIEETEKADETQLMYYQDIIERSKPFSHYLKEISSLDNQKILQQISLQNYVMSSIVSRKMGYVKLIIKSYVFVVPTFLLAMGIMLSVMGGGAS